MDDIYAKVDCMTQELIFHLKVPRIGFFGDRHNFDDPLTQLRHNFETILRQPFDKWDHALSTINKGIPWEPNTLCLSYNR